MPPRFLVHGGAPLHGTVRPAGNKNAALPVLAATLLADGPVDLDNMPRIRDVETMLALLGAPGRGRRVDRPQPGRASTRAPPSRRAARPAALRPDPRLDPPRRPAAGALRPRCTCRRPAATSSAGAGWTPTSWPSRRWAPRCTVGDRYELDGDDSCAGADIFLDEPSVTGTENALMAAVAAAGPHRAPQRRLRSRTCRTSPSCLVAMGAQHRGDRHQHATSSRAASRSHGATFAIGPDHIEIGSFIGLAAVTNGALTIDGVRRRRPARDAARLRAARRPAAAGRRPARSSTRDQERRDPPRPGRARPQARGRPLAGVSRRRDVASRSSRPPSARASS